MNKLDLSVESIVLVKALNDCHAGKDVYEAFLCVPNNNLLTMKEMIEHILTNQEEPNNEQT